MKRKIIKAICSIFICVLVVSMGAPMTVSANTFVVDDEDNLLPIPDAYDVYDSIYNLGDYGTLNHPQDIFVSELGVFIADTDNNRVLVINKDGEVLYEYTEAFGKALKSPYGVFVDDSNQIWIADTGNLRIVVLDVAGNSLQEFTKPDSNLLSNNFTFDAQKIAVNNIGYIYALKGANLMTIDQGNTFRGYMGATEVGFSLSRFLIRTFGSQSQRERTLKQEPAAYSNFAMGGDDMIYGVLVTEKEDQIRRLNSVGNNTYPSDTYGISIEMKGEDTPVDPYFADICVADNGIITVVDKNTGLLYQYDQEGNLLASFGGLGSYAGSFTVPVSLDVDENGFLYVLDYSTNIVTILEPTPFISLVHEAVTLYGEGKYEESKQYWQEVMTIDSNYALAHQGMGKVLYKEKQFEESMAQYKLGDDKEGYSKAYSKHRHDIFRDYFFLVVVCAGVIVYGLYRIVFDGKKYADKWAGTTQMGGDL